VIAFFALLAHIRWVIDTTNAIESVNTRLGFPARMDGGLNLLRKMALRAAIAKADHAHFQYNYIKSQPVAIVEIAYEATQAHATMIALENKPTWPLAYRLLSL
jgi:hypothetical protein